MTELEIIQNSEYFDASYYYAQRPDVLAAGVDAAYHYLNCGWRENSNPSPKFVTQLYLTHHTCDRCPLLDYIEHGAVGDYSGRASADDIRKYRHRRRWRPRMFRTACYTYVSRGYDDLISHQYIVPDWDYICFTDDPDLIRRKRVGIWKIRRALCTKYDSKRNSGWHKTHPGKCCRGYRDSVWIDANVSVLTPYLADEIRTRQADILSPIHNHRDCIYDETDIVQEWNLDTVEKCSAMRHLLESSGMPRHYGLNETNIVYRRHRNRVVRKIDTMWWDLILKYSRRDQLSLSYILWRHGIRPTDIATNNTREDRINFYVAQHTKATKSATFLGNSMKYGFWDWVQMRVLCSLIPVKKWRHNARRHIRRKLKGTETKTETETQLIEPLPNPLPPADMTPVVQSVSENQISLRDCPEEKLPQLLRQKFFEYTGKWPSQELETLNEKIIWAQMFNATDLKTKLADKYTVRDYVADKIGDTYLTKLYDVWDDVNQIDFTSLPDKYVLKFSEGSGKVLLVPNKNKLDIEHAKQQIISWQNNPFWLMACEMQYKNSAKKIIAEEFIDTKIEYKLWIFHGKCKFIKIEIMNDFAENGKPDNQFGKFFYPDWTPADFRTIGDEPNFNIPKPNKLDELIKISEILAEPFDFVRVDFFETHKGKLVFGEMTFSPAAGGVHFEPASKNIEFGKLWTLPPRDDNGFAIYEK